MRSNLSLVAVLVGTLTPSLPAQDTEFFEREVRPLLVKNCYPCHPSGPVTSKIIPALRGKGMKRMPPTGKLKDSEIATLVRWVEIGAPRPNTPPPIAAFDLDKRRREHWAWQPIRITQPPPVRNNTWPLQPIDRFVLNKLESQGIPPAPPADKLTLLRRVTFDLTGLPPTENEITAFLQDSQPGAYERVVDRLLASPQYGERMARRWMDVIRYSESHGSEGDPDTPYAWRYRDYLIRSFNDDVPYDQLVREHIAGDLLPQPRLNTKERLNESRIAVAHFRMVEHGFQPVDPWEDRVKWADNQIDVFSKAFQGLTVSCARCHDHKFDAISQRDYYALFGIFYGMRPSQSAIDAPDVLLKNRDALAALKPRIKQQLATLWRQEVQQIKVQQIDFQRSEVGQASACAGLQSRCLSLTTDYANWPRQGTGAPSQPSPSGEFFIAPAGPKAITGIYPAGVYSHTLSQRHPAVITSPRFKIETDSISVRMCGGNYSFAQLIVENYPVPRSGIYNLRTTGKRDAMTWERWDTSFWKGFTAYIEFSTLDDVAHFQLDDEDLRQKPAPKPAKDGRSWFGVADIRFHNDKTNPTERTVHLKTTDAGPAVDAWANGTATEEQAALLDYLIRHDLLTTAIDRVPLAAEYRRLENEIEIPRRAPGLMEEAPGDHPLLIRGDHRKPGDSVPRAYLTALGGKPYHDAKTMRLQLASDITNLNNPLTTRVIVNRLWSFAFRRGIVRTVDNFGKLGEAPSHPELLDWLASTFMNEGWSIKKTLRMLLTSQTYRMSDTAPSNDAANDWFSHIPLRRLEAEEIRDAILAASGQLDPTMYGPSVPVYYSHDTGATKGDRAKGPLDGNGRRSLYLEVRRNATNPFLEVWDVYKPTSTRGLRDVTTVPAQSLALMNSPFVIEQAAKWATAQPNIETMYLRTFGRKPGPQEKDRAETFRSTTSAASLCQALWNMKEFLYVR